MKDGKGDFREASKAKLLELRLELEVLRMENNRWSTMEVFGVVVDKEGVVIAGGIMEAVRRGLVTEWNRYGWWGLGMRENGNVYDLMGIYGERDAAYGRLVDGVAVLVEEGLFVG